MVRLNIAVGQLNEKRERQLKGAASVPQLSKLKQSAENTVNAW